jgi:SPP1 gp7 family putative phage head morphogenesis protein
MKTPLWISRLQFQYRLDGMVNGLEAEMIPIFEIGLERISGKLVALEARSDRARNYQYKRKYLDAQKSELQKILRQVYSETGDSIKARAIELAMQMPAMTSAMVEKAGITIQLGMPHLNRKTVNAWFQSSQVEGLYFNEWIKKLESNAVARIVVEVREGKVLSEGLRKTAIRIQNALDIRRKSATGLASTSMHQAANWAERVYWEENADKIKGFRFIAELDRRTTPLCRSLSERVFKVGDAPQPPLHWRCRSYLEPILKWWDGEDRNRTTKPARLEVEPRTVKHRDGTTSTAEKNIDIIRKFSRPGSKFITQVSNSPNLDSNLRDFDSSHLRGIYNQIDIFPGWK